ncbi:MAG: hypothetical protein DWQ18_07655 [Crenarchaeota archaeon]|nr:MAG: hypothetical protein DWQ17_02130 [Thermoproteota archaeon]RDJ33042.1 MAG: hypothetical protein DWQ18_07655 [Thermoproteota archaeon]RDJ35756.1 MAG: hypothetical protein DWQ13_09270 [Thermoproteota archaeon]RDJ36454.1 MAG: hypothetical protein DWQ19_07665 [Thermoproteota archaeon]
MCKKNVDRLPRYIQVASPLEFSRLVCALERAPRVSFLHKHDGKDVLSVQMDLLKEKPIIYYTPIESFDHYLSYGFRGGKEESVLSNSTTDATRLYSPIVRIRSLPSNLKAGNGTDDKYHPIELEDLASLAKLSYGFEDAPFPLFSFPKGGKFLLGVFMNFNEEGASYFCHVALDEEPLKPFLKFSTNNGTDPSLVDNPDEHGYSYIKIIRLKDTHPLVDYDQLQN